MKTTLTQDTLLSILRTILTFAGTFLIGRNLLGHPIDSSAFETISGFILALGGMVWGIFTKSASIEQWQSFIRSLLVGMGGLLVSWGVLTSTTLDAITGLVTALLPIIQSYTSKLKVQQLAAGTVVAQTKLVISPTTYAPVEVFTGKVTKAA